MRPGESRRTGGQAEGPGLLSQEQVKFLEAFIDARGDLGAALEASGVSRTRYYTWRKNEEFSAALEATKKLLADEVEAEAVKRAITGRATDNLLVSLLRGRRRDVYGDKVEVEGNVVIKYVSPVRSTPRPGLEGEEDAGGGQVDP